MEKDFYLNERSLASYVEKDWADHFTGRPVEFAFAPFESLNLYSDYHEKSVDFLCEKLSGSKPLRLLEIGSSLGRTFFEACRKIPSIRNATLVEPSKNLSTTFDKIFVDVSPYRYPILKGNVQTAEVDFDTAAIRAACKSVDFKCLNSTFQELADLGTFDLVICSNVIDQCKDPELLVELLKKSTSPGGTLLLSCTYQWQNKYIGNAVKQIMNINDLFNSEWKHLGETNIPFQVRVFERHWLSFLSHVSVFKKACSL